MARPLRIQYAGALCHLTARAYHRRPLFRDDYDKQRYLDLLSHYQDRFGSTIYAYVLLKRAVHLLLETPQGNISKMMQCLGTSYTQYFNRRHGRRGTLFEGRYRSYLIHKETRLAEITRYIHRAHFDRGLKKRKQRDYPWSSYRIYLGRSDSGLVEVETVLARFGTSLEEQRKYYREFVENGSLRENTYPRVISQQIVGPANFVEKVFAEFQNFQLHGESSSLKKAERILRAVSLMLDRDDILGFEEKRRKSLARHIAMYLIRRQTALPLRSIGAMLGVKASAVALAIGGIEKLLKQEDSPSKVKDFLKLRVPLLPEWFVDQPTIGEAPSGSVDS